MNVKGRTYTSVNNVANYGAARYTSGAMSIATFNYLASSPLTVMGCLQRIFLEEISTSSPFNDLLLRGSAWLGPAYV